ncbi:hypothetical protein Amsp01_089530 [Amycolatopsis sp. NBRC 101858]|nr:hypothetical protein Amsp01_089530 [Amycolatopsis sp. NBRC 101858]
MRAASWGGYPVLPVDHPQSQAGQDGDPGEQLRYVVPGLTGVRAVQDVQRADHGPGQAPA